MKNKEQQVKEGNQLYRRKVLWVCAPQGTKNEEMFSVLGV